MTKELETYFANYNELFNSAGWKQLIGDIKQNGAKINSGEATTDVENLHLRKGPLASLGTLVNLQSQIDNAEKDAQESDEEEKAEAKAATASQEI